MSIIACCNGCGKVFAKDKMVQTKYYGEIDQYTGQVTQDKWTCHECVDKESKFIDELLQEREQAMVEQHVKDVRAYWGNKK